jgi:anti-anti-sigma factor
MPHSSLEVKADVAELRLSGDLSFQSIHRAKEALIELVSARAQNLVVSVASIESFDLCGIQLLYSAHRTAAEARKSLRVEAGALAPRLRKFFAFSGLPGDELLAGD